ncbi:L-threonylcarbamoyladenylate synthase [Heliorestis convoluta]|uniref:Threonylcarbamoyl-AMP synthase n=1 Tax=Heliorestis convoluta TaxID=356322 RepID=A0A5Q2MYP1_9FIRM|nr:L-threonylcarbamoyladenylate synthase [Heliorestis convoluta]QGG47091.1 tRNA threonylcarbamoyl adenosine modification protein, Sua5/YciO/YrdC/YwlC family, putative [Heliorestis convoluta]
MKTKHLQPHQIAEAAQLLKQGQLVAFPTETVYGLGANALDSQAVNKIFQAKGRPSDNPLIIHIAQIEDLAQLTTDVPPLAQRLAEKFWPGPLTLVLPAAPTVPREVTAGLNTVAVRMPNHPIALELIKTAGLPVAAPSANRSGKPSPTRAHHVSKDLENKIAAIIDGGPCSVGIESTVVDATGPEPIILRPGGITFEMLEATTSERLTTIAPGLHGTRANLETDETPRSPGMKYTHYAPQAPLYLLTGTWEEQVKKLEKIQERIEKSKEKIGLFISEESFRIISKKSNHRIEKGAIPVIQRAGSRENLKDIAAGLFDALRAFDETEANLIIAETYPTHGIGLALMNRLTKAAGDRIWNEDN